MATDSLEKIDEQAQASRPSESISFKELRKRYGAVRNHVRRALFGVKDQKERTLVRKSAFLAADSLKQEIDPLIEQYKIDKLTGLNTARTFEEILNVEAKRGRRLTLIFGDLDNFKPINDLYGHEEGNKVLSQIGKTIARSIRPGDTAARYGGDEFVLLLPETDEEGARVVAQRINEGIGKLGINKKLSTRGTALSMSTGIRNVNLDNPINSLKEADREMYEQKRERKR